MANVGDIVFFTHNHSSSYSSWKNKTAKIIGVDNENHADLDFETEDLNQLIYKVRGINGIKYCFNQSNFRLATSEEVEHYKNIRGE